MATKKRAKGKATKTVARKTVKKSAAGRKAKPAKQVARPAAKPSSATTAVGRAVEATGVTGMMDLLRAWSPSRYSSR